MDKREDVYNDAFGDMLNDEHKSELANESVPPLEALIGQEEDTRSYEEKLEEWSTTENYFVPPCLNDPDYIKHIEKEPIQPLTKEQEFSASNLGLQELRKTQNYIKSMHKAISAELRRVYITYPLLLEKNYEEALTKVQEEMSKIVEDMEHFIAGDIDKMERIKEDWQLFQEFEEKRLILLHKISDFYNEHK